MVAAEESFIEMFSPDWTVAPESGRSNSSKQYLALTEEVSRLIRGEAFSLMNGKPGADSVAALIMAQLAHKHHLVPVELQGDNHEIITGSFEIKGRRYTFVATPDPDV